MEFITTDYHDHIFEIVLNRPKKRNAITIQMLEEIAAAVDLAEQNKDVRVIILRGEGKSFSTGLDISGFGGMPERLGDDWLSNGLLATRLWQQSINRLHESFLPSIALIHSYTIGAGFELALACDFRIAAEFVVISLEEARLGIIPDAGGTTRLTHIAGPARARELIMTGKRIDAATAEKWGVVNQVVPTEELVSAGEALAKEIMQCAPLAVSAAKRVINALENPAEGFHLEMVEQRPLFASKDLMEGITAIQERREPNWQGR